MQHDSGYPSNWMPDVIRMLPDQVIAVVPAGAGVGDHEGAVRPQPADPARRVRPRAADRLRQRRQPAARARGRAARPDGGAAGDRRVAAADRHAGARRERPARRRRRHRRTARRRSARRGCCSRSRSPARRSCRSTPSVAAGAGLRVRRSRCSPASSSARRRRGSRRAPIRSTRCAAPGRSTSDHSSVTRKALLVVQATVSVVLVAGATMLARSLGKLERQDFGFEIAGPRGRVVEPAAGDLHTADTDRALSRPRGAARIACPASQAAGLALYNPLTDNWGELILVAGHPRAEAERAGRRVVGPRERELPAEPRRDARARPALHARPTTRPPRPWPSSTKRSSAVSSRATRIRSTSTSASTCRRTSSTYRIVGIVRDAKFAGFHSTARRGRCSTCRWRRPSTTRTP